MGLSQEGQCQKYPRGLTRAQGSSLAVARVRVGLVGGTFASAGPVVMGSDETLERRRGEKSKAKGLYRAPVRASRSPMGTARGVRWLWALLLSEIPGAGRVWAVPFLTAVCPAERSQQQRGQRHQPLPQGAGQRRGLRHRW